MPAATNDRTIDLYENNAGALFMLASDCDEAVMFEPENATTFAEDAPEWHNWHMDASDHTAAQDVIDNAWEATQNGHDGMVLIASYNKGQIERHALGGNAASIYMGDTDQEQASE